MDFPQQTKELATRVAQEIKQTCGDDPLERAKGVYTHLRGKFGYGFREGIAQGYFLRWPHEIEKEWECIEAATYTYAVAEAAGLKPRIMSVDDWQNSDTGHEAVDVDINDRRILIDPLNRMFGRVLYHRTKGIFIQDNELTDRCVLPCKGMDEVSKDRLIARTEYYRSDEGILNLLISGQKYQGNSGEEIYLSIDPKKQVLELQTRIHPPFIDSTYFTERYELKDKDVAGVVMEEGFYADSDWVKLKGKEPFWRASIKVAKGSKPKLKFFPLKTRGRRYVLHSWLFETLRREKFPDVQISDSSHRDLLDSNHTNYLFENRELPIEAFGRRFDELLEKGITPASKGYFNDLKNAYLRVIEWDQEVPSMQHIMDAATLKLMVEREAKEQGVHPNIVYSRMLKIMGQDPREINKKVTPSMDLLKDHVTKHAILRRNLQSVLERILNRGLLRKARSSKAL